MAAMRQVLLGMFLSLAILALTIVGAVEAVREMLYPIWEAIGG